MYLNYVDCPVVAFDRDVYFFAAPAHCAYCAGCHCWHLNPQFEALYQDDNGEYRDGLNAS